MIKRYLWLAACFQFALISGTGARNEDHEHIHIKVHVPDVTRTHVHHHQIHQQRPQQLQQQLQQPHTYAKQQYSILQQQQQLQHYPNKKFPVHDFDLMELTENAVQQQKQHSNLMMPMELMDSSAAGNYGQMFYGNDIATSMAMDMTSAMAQQNSLNKQSKHQLTAPDAFTILTGTEDTNEDSNDVNSGHQIMNSNTVDNFFNDYIKKFNKKSNQFSPIKSTTHKRKKYGNNGIGETYFKQQPQQQQPQQQQQYRPQQQPQQYRPQQQQQFQIKYYDLNPTPKPPSEPYNLLYDQQPQRENFHPLQFSNEDSNDFDDANIGEDISSSTSVSDSEEDMAAAFNSPHTISYVTTSNQQQQGLNSHQTMLPTHLEPWHQYYQQQQRQHNQQQRKQQQQQRQQHEQEKQQHQLELQLQQQQPESQEQPEFQLQQNPDIQQHSQQTQHRYRKQPKYKQKSPKPQFVLQPKTVLRLSSPSLSMSSTSTSSLLPSKSTAPISNEYSEDSSASFETESPWTVTQQAYQQQLDKQQKRRRKQKQHHSPPQQQQQQQHGYYKKYRNRNKRKRNRIIVDEGRGT